MHHGLLVLFRVIRRGIGISRRLSVTDTVCAYRRLGCSPSNPSVSRTDQPPSEKESGGDGKGSSPETLKRLVLLVSQHRSFLSLQKLRRRSFDDLESEIGGFAFEIINLQFAVLSVVTLCSSVDECHAIAQHAINQSSQLGSHSLNGNGSPELGSQSAKLRAKVGIA